MKGLVLLACILASVYGKPGLTHGDGAGFLGGNSGGSAQINLVGVPDVDGYSGLHYPHLELLDLGTVEHGQIPPKIVKISTTVALKVPKPYPVKVPHNVPYPVHIDKPYPVPVTQVVKVPQPVPVEVIKSIPVPIEVPKPYPVPHNEYSQPQNLDSYGGSNYGEHQGFQPIGAYANTYSKYANQNQEQGYQGQEDASSNYAVSSSDASYETKERQEEN